MRDLKGRFVKGHAPLSTRDKTTGKFIKKTMESTDKQDKYSIVRSEVDNFLQELNK